MLIIRKYVYVGLSVILLISLFSFFSDEYNMDSDYAGIVHDVRTSTNGFTFYIDCSEGSFRCFFSEKPVEYGYYGIIGEFSSDRNIFFIDRMILLD